MKKALLLIVSIIIIILSISNKENDEIIIPSSSIRFRIIPNSNELNDLYIKEKVKEEISTYFINKTNNIEEVRNNINENIKSIDNKINKVFVDNDYNKPYNISFGMNYFPEKTYKGISYQEGYYESLVIKIGEAKGGNYWCVLFPPLCMIDDNKSENEYKSLVSEIIKRIIKK